MLLKTLFITFYSLLYLVHIFYLFLIIKIFPGLIIIIFIDIQMLEKL